MNISTRTQIASSVESALKNLYHRTSPGGHFDAEAALLRVGDGELAERFSQVAFAHAVTMARKVFTEVDRRRIRIADITGLALSVDEDMRDLRTVAHAISWLLCDMSDPHSMTARDGVYASAIDAAMRSMGTSMYLSPSSDASARTEREVAEIASHLRTIERPNILNAALDAIDSIADAQSA